MTILGLFYGCRILQRSIYSHGFGDSVFNIQPLETSQNLPFFKYFTKRML